MTCHLPEKASIGGDEILPRSVFVTHEAPVNPNDEVEQKEIRCYKVDEANFPKPEAENRFVAHLQGRRVGNEKTGHHQSGNTGCVQPMVNPDGQFPYKNPEEFVVNNLLLAHNLSFLY
nr:hypothetical protein [Haliscomenobacter sp.]